MKQAKKTTIRKLLIILGIFVVVAGITIYLVTSKIKADQVQPGPVITPEDIETIPAATVNSVPDSRSEVSVPIVMYHHIRNYNQADDTVGTNLSVSPENFNAQIKYLKDNGFTTITFTDLLNFPTKKLPDKPIILTFDDGYSDVYTNAFLPLKENGQVGVFYIISGFIGRSDTLTTIQIKEMSNNNMEIGSHTVGHPDLTKITPAKLASELSESKKNVESIIGKSISSFCYPSGKNNIEVNNAVKNAGYSTATTTVADVSSTSENKFTLSRVRINPTDSLQTFRNKISTK